MKTIPLFKVYMAPYAAEKAAEVLNSGFIGQGKYSDLFEDKLKLYFDSPFVAVTNSATSAEHIALYLLRRPDKETRWPGWYPGDEVISTPLTCTATNFPAITQGLRLKWVDVDETLNMDIDCIYDALTPTTKIIFPVLWGGMPLDIDKMESMLDSAENKLGFRPVVIYDCAHAFGSLYKGKQVCNFPGIFTYSFQAIKHITSIDGGALVTQNESLWKRAKLVRWYGLSRETTAKDFRCGQMVEEAGFKMNLVDVNAVVGIENLMHANFILDKFRDNAAYYRESLTGIEGIRLLPNPPYALSSSWIFTLLADRRDDLVEMLKSKGIMSSRVHERNDIYPVTASFRNTSLPRLDALDSMRLCIPNGFWVTPEDREYIVDCIKGGW